MRCISVRLKTGKNIIKYNIILFSRTWTTSLLFKIWKQKETYRAREMEKIKQKRKIIKQSICFSISWWGLWNSSEDCTIKFLWGTSISSLGTLMVMELSTKSWKIVWIEYCWWIWYDKIFVGRVDKLIIRQACHKLKSWLIKGVA